MMAESETVRVELPGGRVLELEARRSDNPDPEGRREEELVFGAREVVEQARKRAGNMALGPAVRQVAEHYGLERRAVLEAWKRHYLPTVAMEGGELGLALGLLQDSLAERREQR